VLECVINVSEGRRADVLDALESAAGAALLDRHTDAHHNRTVLTLAGPEVEDAARAIARVAVANVDINEHSGAHPRLGAVDVVPFVPLAGSGMIDAVAARDSFAAWSADELGVPCFLYGPERTLPEIRRAAFAGLEPDTGPRSPHPTAGAICAGARPVLVAYNLWLASADVAAAIRTAAEIRNSAVRALGLLVGGTAQVSLNLVDPMAFGPERAWDEVATRAPVARAELVGLLPRAVLERVPSARWTELDLDESRTIEARVEARSAHWR
jgi:glutamate formiminotransferase / 5-formyltetrahydrofolate cyclo-ligase